MIDCRDTRKHGNDGGNSNVPIGPLLWIAIMVALWNALVPLGPPSSRTIGSAFSPATTSVALKARANQPIIAQSLPSTPDHGGDSGATDAVMAFGSPPTHAMLPVRNPWPKARETTHPFDPASFRQARAPPIAHTI